MTAFDDIKKAIEDVGPLKVEFTPDCDEFNSIIAPINDDYDGTFFTVIGCGDKQDKLGGYMALAVNKLPELLSTFESLQRENEELRKKLAGCDWYWPEDDTSSDACADSVWSIAEVYDLKPADVLAYSRGGVVETRYFAFLPPADDSDSDDNFEVDEPTEEAVSAKITSEIERRTALASTGGEHHAE